MKSCFVALVAEIFPPGQPWSLEELRARVVSPREIGSGASGSLASYALDNLIVRGGDSKNPTPFETLLESCVGAVTSTGLRLDTTFLSTTTNDAKPVTVNHPRYVITRVG